MDVAGVIFIGVIVGYDVTGIVLIRLIIQAPSIRLICKEPPK
jgi:hypothetical protein